MLPLLFACADPPDPAPDLTCDGPLFGAPSENSGLSPAECAPEIAGEAGAWSPPEWDAARLDRLRALVLDDPPVAPADDPYRIDPGLLPPTDGVCAARVRRDTYRLQTFPDAASAHRAGFDVTHGGACGLCSSFQDLAVYAGTPDLTQPVRACGIEGVLGGPDATRACLEALGFTPACAAIWTWNTVHTRERCFSACVAALADPYHLPDGSLNACIQCDEDESGPVFKAVAGRTRRNSGLASALCRPCDTVWRVDHLSARPR